MLAVRSPNIVAAPMMNSNDQRFIISLTAREHLEQRMPARPSLQASRVASTGDYPIWSSRTRSDHLFPENPLLVDDVGFRHSHQLVPFVSLPPGVDQYGKREIEPLDERRNFLLGGDTIDADGEDDGNPSFSKFLYKTSIEGISSRQGLHHVAQKFRETIRLTKAS